MTARKHLPVVQPDEVYAENAALRRRIADEQRAELDAAIAAVGPDHERYCRWIEHDKLGLLPPRISYGYNDGSGWQNEPPFDGERVEQDVVTFVTEAGIKYDCHTTPIKGVKYYPFRWSLGFQALTSYRPQSAEQLKAAAERRHAEATAKLEATEREEAERRARQPELPFGEVR